MRKFFRDVDLVEVTLLSLIVITIIALIVFIVLVCMGVVSNDGSFDSAQWVANPANPASPLHFR